MATLHAAPVGELDPLVLYAILRLRTDVFVVEQECAYPELDGRDVEPGALLLWGEDGARRILGTLRLLIDSPDVRRIGRVATAAHARGSGVAAELVGYAIELAGGAEVVLDAQAHLRGWYQKLGFLVDGPEFVEDDIPHVPMRLNR
ncbi:MAG TPA: GNAT family N-acetyltransferase [Jatrophihabitans sp.]|jgi:ElaA protein